MEDPRTVNLSESEAPERPAASGQAAVHNLTEPTERVLDRVAQRLNNLKRQNHQLQQRVAELEQALAHAVQEIGRLEELVEQLLLQNELTEG